MRRPRASPTGPRRPRHIARGPRRDGTGTIPRSPARRSARPPIESESASSRALSPTACGPGQPARSSVPLLVFLDQSADLRQFLRRRLARRESAQDQALRRAAERALKQVARQLALRPFAWPVGFVNVGALAFVAPHQALLGHDLQQLENGGVLRGLAARHGFMHVAHRGGAACPKDGQDFQLAIGGSRRIGDLRRHSTKKLLRRASFVKEKRRQARRPAPPGGRASGPAFLTAGIEALPQLNPETLHPARYLRRINLVASGELSNFSLAAFQMRFFFGNRVPTEPSSTPSVSGPA